MPPGHLVCKSECLGLQMNPSFPDLRRKTTRTWWLFIFLLLGINLHYKLLSPARGDSPHALSYLCSRTLPLHSGECIKWGPACSRLQSCILQTTNFSCCDHNYSGTGVVPPVKMPWHQYAQKICMPIVHSSMVQPSYTEYWETWACTPWQTRRGRQSCFLKAWTSYKPWWGATVPSYRWRIWYVYKILIHTIVKCMQE